MSKARARALAKRHIYACLSTTLRNDDDGGAEYLWALVEGPDGQADKYEGPKLSEEEMHEVVDEVSRELRKRSQPRPTVKHLRSLR